MLISKLLICVFILFVIFYGLVLMKRRIQNYLLLNKLPGDPARDVITGNIPLFLSIEDLFKKVREWGDVYYPLYKVSGIMTVTANFLRAEDFELILSNPKHKEKSFIYNVFHNWLSTGLLTSHGEKWATRRKILTRAFHFNILQNFIPVFNEQTEDLVNSLKKQCHQPFICVNPYVAKFTLKTIMETAMGVKLKLNTTKGERYQNSIFEIGQIYLYRLVHIWFSDPIVNLFSPKSFKERKVINFLHKFSEEVIAERQKTFRNIAIPKEDDVYTGKVPLAMLDLLLKAKEEEGIIDDRGIREEVDTFLFGGYDTTAAALSFALMLIACHKDVQEQIVEEMTAVLGDLRKKPTFKDLQELKYLERCIKETLRLYPSVHFISRKLGEDLVTSNGYFLPKNTIVNLHIYDLHRDPRVYPNPEKFDPDRFLPEHIQKRHPFAYVPFSAGPRNCIGQKFAFLEMKAMLCGVLGNFILEAVDTPESIVIIADLILRTREEIRVKFVPRQIA